MDLLFQLSDDFLKLWEKGEFFNGILETFYLTFVSAIVAYLIGIPLGVLLNITSKNGIKPNKWINAPLNFIVNIFCKREYI